MRDLAAAREIGEVERQVCAAPSALRERCHACTRLGESQSLLGERVPSPKPLANAFSE